MNEKFKSKVENLFSKNTLDLKEIAEIMKISEMEAKYLLDFLEKNSYVKVTNLVPRKAEFIKKDYDENFLILLKQNLSENTLAIIKNEILGSEEVSIPAIQRRLLYGYHRAAMFLAFLEQKKFIVKKETDYGYKVTSNDFDIADLNEWLGWFIEIQLKSYIWYLGVLI